jgi:SAM-dependent methyltransferase
MIAARLNEILACPRCHNAVARTAAGLECSACRARYAVQDGVPVFLDRTVDVALAHASNAIGEPFNSLLREGKDFILHIGAGGSPMRYPNCIEFEHKIFRHTDVVGDAHQLPFRDEMFDRVFALNVFEHLREPKRAAAEIFRVLKPGGSVSIHTAFLQALHEEPHHYFNATEFGVREWFTGFEIENVHVTGNFGPGVMLGFLCANIIGAARMGGMSPKEEMRFTGTTIGEWADFWAGKLGEPPGFAALQAMPQDIQKRIAGGFELIARKPSRR